LGRRIHTEINEKGKRRVIRRAGGHLERAVLEKPEIASLRKKVKRGGTGTF